MKRISPSGSMAYIEVSSDPDALFPFLSAAGFRNTDAFLNQDADLKVILAISNRHPPAQESMRIRLGFLSASLPDFRLSGFPRSAVWGFSAAIARCHSQSSEVIDSLS